MWQANAADITSSKFAIGLKHWRKSIYKFERETIEYTAFDVGSNRETKDQVSYL